MTRLAGFLMVLLLAAAPVMAKDCEPQLLRPATLSLLKPLLELRTKQVSDSFDSEGRWRGESPVRDAVERQFDRLLKNRTKAGDESVAYLLNVYMGEHPSEDLVCEVIKRGRRMLPLVKAYASCMPLTGLEPLHKELKGSGVLPGMAIEGIVRKEKCEHVD